MIGPLQDLMSSTKDRPANLGLLGFGLDKSSDRPIYRQLFDGLRYLILEGRIAPGARMPPTRALAEDLRISRNTVMTAYELLISEGYLEGHSGSGTTVSNELPDNLLKVARHSTELTPVRVRDIELPRRGAKLANTVVSTPAHPDRPRALRIGLPETDSFPFRLWGRLLSKRWHDPGLELRDYPDPAGYRPLSPNPPKDTDGRREDSGRGWVRELQGRWPGVLG